MKPICVITGGGSGMGLEAAKLLAQDYRIILVGRTVAKLEGAIAQLEALGGEVEAFPGDVSDRACVQELAAYAAGLGSIKVVLNAAGLSPKMATGEKVFTVNAMGTIYIVEEFAKVMGQGGCILNVASMAGHMLPDAQVPLDAFKLALADSDAFAATLCGMLNAMPAEEAPATAYVMSKNFVIWYSRQVACQLGKSGIRILSISPGTFKTPMGEIEGAQAAAMAEMGALGRLGEVIEIARVMAFLVSDGASYITGTDILCDGGSIAALRSR